MAENQTAVQDQTEFAYPVKIEDVGPATKKITVEIPGERIASKLDENFKEIRVKAALPGFRIGHAPRKLVEKRFSKDVRDDVKRALISESYSQVLDKNKISVVGEPEFENADKIELPENGSMNYVVTVEITPDFTLPDLKGIAIKKPKIEIGEKHIAEAMDNLRKQQGTLVPVEDRGLAGGDYATADFAIKIGDKEVGTQKNAQFIVQDGRIGGIFVEGVEAKLADAKIGDTKSFAAKAPEDHPSAEIAGKDVEIFVTVQDIKKLELAEINQEFLDNLGFKDNAELEEALKEQMDLRIKNDVQQAMRDQVTKFLMDSVQFELPTKLSQRQADRVIRNRITDLMMRQVPQNQIEANIEKIKAGASDVAVRELKSFFLLSKLAEQEGVEVTEAELNGQIAMMAMQMGERPEKLRDRMQKEGTLANLYNKMVENRAIDKVLLSATIEEVAAPEAPKA